MKPIIVTGASQGIGAAVAEAFASEPGARIGLLSRNETLLMQVADSCRRRGAVVEVLPCDATEEHQVLAVAEKVRGMWGAPAVLVNNAGLFKPGGILDLSAEDFREQVEVNLTSAFLVTKAFLPSMLEAGSGDVFFMGSVASIRGYPGGAAYCAAKHGLLGLARVLREETKEKGLRVCTFLAGATFTPSWEGTTQSEERFMPAGDIAAAMLEVHHLSSRTVVEEVLLRPQLGDV